MSKDLTAEKAREILTDGKVRGKTLSKKQKRFMGWVAGGRLTKGTKSISTADFHSYMKEHRGA